MRIILDMDEVLVDFVSAAIAIHGWDRTELEKIWHPGVWSMEAAMSVTSDQFWAPIHSVGEQFWVDLKPLPWFDGVVGLVDKLSHGDWLIATAPSRCATSYSGKVKWLKNRFGASFDRFAITPHKHMFAHRTAYLVDDREETVKKFRASGGKGVLFPRRNNSMHMFDGDLLQYLRLGLTGNLHEGDAHYD